MRAGLFKSIQGCFLSTQLITPPDQSQFTNFIQWSPWSKKCEIEIGQMIENNVSTYPWSKKCDTFIHRCKRIFLKLKILSNSIHHAIKKSTNCPAVPRLQAAMGVATPWLLHIFLGIVAASWVETINQAGMQSLGTTQGRGSSIWNTPVIYIYL